MNSIIFTGGSIVTCEPGGDDPEALLVEDDRIAAIGSAAELEVRAPGGERIDLDGQALLPAFIDPHHHFSNAVFDRRSPDLHHPPGTKISEILSLIERHVESSPGSGWIRVQGYDPAGLRGRRPPLRAELDDICGDRPLLVIAYSFHDAVLNSAGLAAMGWTRSTPDPPGGVLVRSRNGELTGEIREAAFFLVEARSRTTMLPEGEDAWLAEAGEHARALLRAGIARVADPTVDPAFDRLYLRAADSGLLPIVVHRMPVGPSSALEPRLDAEPTGSGPTNCPVGPAKLFLDGAERCAICASSLDLARSALRTLRLVGAHGLAPLRAATRLDTPRRGPDGHWHSGISFWRTDDLGEALGKAARSGLQVAQHAIGNDAVGQALDVLERSGSALHDLPGPPRIEHAIFLNDALERRLADSGAMAVVQPRFLHDVGDDFARMALPGRLRAFGFRSLLDARVPLAGSSDYPVAAYEPLAAIQTAVTRRTASGLVLGEDQSIGIDEALGMYTLQAARALDVADETGSLVEGKRADLVVLGTDPRATEPDHLGEIPVVETYIAGARAFRTEA